MFNPAQPSFRTYEDVVTHYFKRGIKYNVILQYLKIYHGITVSLRTLERDVRRLGLRRNGVSEVSPDRISEAVASVQLRSGNRAGYRRTWYHVNVEHGIRLTQRQVLLELRRQNAAATALRASRVLTRRQYCATGPNHVWHCDGYDKLKPYGFAIHGCIDGYSRKVLWVQCALTNNDPSVILYYYLTSVRSVSGAPMLLRTDRGTENVLIAAAQCTLREQERSHIFGTSQHNQRIEAWWCILRKGWTEIWLRLFNNLVTFGNFDISNSTTRSLLWFCFNDVIQSELNWFVDYWNNHTIRVGKRSGCIGGVPNHLYFLHSPGLSNRLRRVEEGVVQILFSRATNPLGAEREDYAEQRNQFEALMREHHLTRGSDREERTSLFLALQVLLGY